MRNAYALALLSIVAAAPVCATAPRQEAAAVEHELAPVELALAARVSDERAAERVRELVSLGPRMGGTTSGSAAATVLAKRFTEAGLEAELVQDPETWCHESSGWRLVARASALEGEAEPREAELERAWPYGFSPSASGKAPLALEPAAGVAWLAERHGRRDAAVEGPVLQLVDGETTADGAYPKALHLREGDDNPRPVFALARGEGRLLRDWLAEGRSVELEYRLEARNRRARPTTVVARIPARAGAPPGHFLFCAHGDSDAGGPGADDNASGEAVVLEIAGAWAGAIAAGEVPAPARELRFAIWGKEIHSSRAYLERVSAESPIVGVVNFDQAGFGSGSDQVNLEPDDLPANRSLVLALAGVLRDAAGAPGFPARWATNKSLGGTDSYVFSNDESFRDHGRPSVTVFSSAWDAPAEHPRTPGMPGESWSERELVSVDYDLYYHSAGDTPENTTDREPYNMGWCARVALLGARRWLEAQ